MSRLRTAVLHFTPAFHGVIPLTCIYLFGLVRLCDRNPQPKSEVPFSRGISERVLRTRRLIWPPCAVVLTLLPVSGAFLEAGPQQHSILAAFLYHNATMWG